MSLFVPGWLLGNWKEMIGEMDDFFPLLDWLVRIGLSYLDILMCALFL